MSQSSLEAIDGIGHFRLSGAWRFPQAVQAIGAAIAKADRLGLSRMLIVTTEATGFDPPSMADRHAMVREWSQASMGHVVIAMVVPPAFIDPERFGVVAAGNFGMHGNVFSNESEAQAWLLDAR
ncbi:MAG TPA: hypothetical protein VFH12_05285 [Pseudoxanthomonas sp.]|nr:hypothetical protein [Pseudoxanthomonas sp.]